MNTRNARQLPVGRTCYALVLAALVVLAASTPRVGRAQSSSAKEGPSRVVALNPFLLLWGYISGEVEQRLTNNFSGAIAGSYINWDDGKYSNLDAKVRFYPNEKALRGFGVAMSAGVTRVRYKEYLLCSFPGETGCPAQMKTQSSPSIAIEIGYQWLLGSKQRTAITLGGGVKRFFDFKNSDNINEALPTGRLTIGYAW